MSATLPPVIIPPQVFAPIILRDPVVAPEYPVGEIGGAAPAAAYSLMKLRSDYTGPALRVRRVSDNTELDIGFVGTLFDMDALLTFIAGTTARVRTWYDQSGNGRDATQVTAGNQPSIDGRTVRGNYVVVFNGGPTLAVPAGVALDGQAATVLVCGGLFGQGLDGIMQLGAGFYFFSQQALRTAGYVPPIVAGSSMNVLGFRLSPTGQAIFQNEQQSVGPVVAAGALAGGTIGNLPSVGGYAANMELTTLILYPRTLSDADFAAAKASLHLAHGVPQTTTMRVFGTGDSIFAGSVNNWISPIEKAMDQLPATVRLVNFSAGGSKTTDLISVYPTFSPYIAAQPSIVVTNMGTNDIALTADSAATIYARLATICGLAHADGAKMIISTILPAVNINYTAPRLAELAALNTMIRDGWASIADGLIDHAADPIMGAPDAPLDTSLYLDGLHPTALGVSFLTGQTAAAISALL